MNISRAHITRITRIINVILPRGAGMTVGSLVRHLIFSGQLVGNFIVSYLFNRILAVRFGLSAERDAFDIAFSIPFFILSVSGFGWLHGIVTTHFSKMLSIGSTRLDSTFSELLTVMAGAGLGLVGLCLLFSRPLVELLAPGLSLAVQHELKQQMLLMLPLVFTLGLSTYLSAVLTAYRVPIGVEFSQFGSRIGFVLMALLVGWEFSLLDVAYLLVLGSAAFMVIEWWILARVTALRFRPALPRWDKETAALAKQSAGFLVAAVFANLSNAYMRGLATIEGPGTVATLTYALMLVSPVGLLIGKPVAMITGPIYLRHYGRGEIDSAKRMFMVWTAVSVLVSVAAVFVLNLVIGRVIDALFGGGRFDEASVVATRDLFSYLIWALPGMVVTWTVFFPTLNRLGSQVGATIYVSGYIVQIVLSWLLFPKMGIVGLAWAYVACIMWQGAISLGYVFLSFRGNAVRGYVQAEG